MRIQIIGYSGSGKSTLAKLLGEYYRVPYLYLDTVHFYGDWKERTSDEQNVIVTKFIQENNGWVIDGNYSRVAPERFVQSDLTILLDYNRFFCYRSCKKRYKTYKNKYRESLPCKEKFDWEFKKWILFESRTKARKQKLLNNLNKTSGKKMIFKNRKQLNAWLRTLGIEVEGEVG